MYSKSIAHDDPSSPARRPDHQSPSHGTPDARHDRTSRFLKRFMDLAIAILALIFLAPIFLIIAITVLIDDGRPIIFSQRRRGRNGRYFTCYKFRTMVPDAAERLEALLASNCELRREWEADQKLKDDPRLISTGHFLRRFSLDELPQLINIIRGEMSIVGPRPIIEGEVRRYGEDIVHYDSVRPGVVGLWQINGRNNTSYAERVKLDVKYAETQSVSLDLCILMKSIPAILGRRGAY